MYDAIIIGCGPAGMTSAIYLARQNKKVLILEKETIGGQISSSPLVENYPGFIAISGSELAGNMFDQVTALGVDFELEEVTKIIDGDIKKVVTTDNTYETKTVIIATGCKYRLLGLDNETNLIGKGIHFCVSCDGAFYKDKTVAVIGGGNSAVINAISLSEICKKVYVIQNLDDLTSEKNLADKLREKTNVEIIVSSVVSKINGTDSLESIEINNNKTIKVDGMFLSIGMVPQNNFVKDLIKLDIYNYVDSIDCKTNIPGISVAGDLRTKPYRQVTTAVNDGTIAANLVIDFLK